MQYDSPLCLQTGLPLRPHTLQGPAGLRSATLDELEVGVGNFLGQGHRGEGGNGELPARRVCRLERRQLKTPERCLQISGVRPVSRLGWVAGSGQGLSGSFVGTSSSLFLLSKIFLGVTRVPAEVVVQGLECPLAPLLPTGISVIERRLCRTWGSQPAALGPRPRCRHYVHQLRGGGHI